LVVDPEEPTQPAMITAIAAADVTSSVVGRDLEGIDA
jgi:hypothetical protein